MGERLCAVGSMYFFLNGIESLPDGILPDGTNYSGPGMTAVLTLNFPSTSCVISRRIPLIYFPKMSSLSS